MNEQQEAALAAYNAAMLEAFAGVLQGEASKREAELAIKQVQEKYAPQLRQAEQQIEKGWHTIAALLSAAGLVEETLPGNDFDFKIAYITPPERVECPDVAAVPDEWCKIERTVKKKEVLDHLKKLLDAGQPLPNWATIARGHGSLGYKPIKKKGVA
jgi:hypothetical protein